MDWQRYVSDVMGEMLPNGLPAYREGIVLVMRQSGKTTWLLAEEIETGLRPVPHRIAYTAQTGLDARKKMLVDQWPMIERSPLRAAFNKPSMAQGSEALVFKNGSRIDVLASGPSAGHGKTLDKGVIDEAFDDVDDRREQSMLPAMLTKPKAQLLIVSTMGTDASVYLNRKVDMGRALVDADKREGVAYFEWSVPPEEDIDDPAVWHRFMPAMGGTQSEAAVAHARMTMTEGEFRRAICNQRTASEERVIPLVTWRLVQTKSVAPANPLTFGVEVSPDRDWAAIVSCGQGGERPCVELVDYRPGNGWVAPRLAELVAKHGGRAALESRGPAGALCTDLRASGVEIVELSAGDATQAAGQFYDLVADGGVWVRSDDRFETALSAAGKQPVADAWRFARRAGGDVCPLNAACIALWAHRNGQPKRIFAY